MTTTFYINKLGEGNLYPKIFFSKMSTSNLFDILCIDKEKNGVFSAKEIKCLIKRCEYALNKEKHLSSFTSAFDSFVKNNKGHIMSSTNLTINSEYQIKSLLNLCNISAKENLKINWNI